jgi:hypothetical protein
VGITYFLIGAMDESEFKEKYGKVIKCFFGGVIQNNRMT